jgi:hypothetical protein
MLHAHTRNPNSKIHTQFIGAQYNELTQIHTSKIHSFNNQITTIMKNLLLFSLALLMSASLYSQRNNNADYWNTWRYTAKDGMEQQFMEAAAKKTAMFNKTPETAIVTYRIITGPNTGTFERVESGKSPADYDLDRSAEGKHWNDNVAQFVAKANGQVRWRRLVGESYDADPDDNTPAKYVRRTTFSVKADKIMHFRRMMERVSKVAAKRGWQASRHLFRLENGGNRNEFVLAVTFDTYKRAVSNAPENETTFEEDFNEMFGYGSFEEDAQNFDESLEMWGEFVEMLVLVPEMSTGMME